MRISDIDLIGLLPQFLQDDRTARAMCDAVAPQLEALAAQSRHALILPRLAELPDSVLDLLAEELNISWFLRDADGQAKRSIIQNAYSTHAHFGTPGAIEQVARQYFGDAVLEEWWEYEAEPFHFRLCTGNIEEGTRQAAQVIQIVNQVKNARSVFDGLYLDTSVGKVQIFGAAAVQTADIIYMGVDG